MPSDVSISPNGTILTAQSQALAQSQKKNANKRKLMGLEAFYSILAAALLTQNHEANSFKDKISGFFIYTVIGNVAQAGSILYYRCFKDMTLYEIFKEHASERKWQFTVAFMLCLVATIIIFVSNKGDMDSPPPENFYLEVAKGLIDFSILLSVGDFNKVIQIYKEGSDNNAAAADIEQSPAPTSIVTHNNRQNTPELRQSSVNGQTVFGSNRTNSAIASPPNLELSHTRNEFQGAAQSHQNAANVPSAENNDDNQAQNEDGFAQLPRLRSAFSQ